MFRTTTVALFLLAAAACGADSPDDPTLASPWAGAFALELAAVDGDLPAAAAVRTALYLHLPPEGRAPRVMEVFLRHSPSVRLRSNAPGPALAESDKQLVVQQRDPTTVRVLLFSARSLTAIPGGELAHLEWERADSGSATVEILTERQIFAPAEANDGLRVSDPLALAFP